MATFEKILNELIPILVGILTLVGAFVGSWLTYKFTSKDRLKYEQGQAVKKFYSLITKAEKTLVALEIDYKINKKLSDVCKNDVKQARDQLISFYDEQSIILPEKLTARIDTYVQRFLNSQASVLLSDYVGINDKKEVLKKLNDDVAELRSIKKALRSEFRKIIGVEK